ncbi:MAG: hypothetical protein FWG87_05995 [Defluviitaleaceae bacterium]|nr:hypothetical protein [Defluviitaleaceae bacterium]
MQKTRNTRFIALFLVFVMAVSLFTATPFATENSEDDTPVYWTSTTVTEEDAQVVGGFNVLTLADITAMTASLNVAITTFEAERKKGEGDSNGTPLTPLQAALVMALSPANINGNTIAGNDLSAFRRFAVHGFGWRDISTPWPGVPPAQSTIMQRMLDGTDLFLEDLTPLQAALVAALSPANINANTIAGNDLSAFRRFAVHGFGWRDISTPWPGVPPAQSTIMQRMLDAAEAQ